MRREQLLHREALVLARHLVAGVAGEAAWSDGQLVLAEQSGRAQDLQEIGEALAELHAACWAGCDADVLKTALASLRALRTTMQVLAARDASQLTAPVVTRSLVSQLTREQHVQADRDN